MQHPPPTEYLFKTQKSNEIADSWELKNVMKQIPESERKTGRRSKQLLHDVR